MNTLYCTICYCTLDNFTISILYCEKRRHGVFADLPSFPTRAPKNCFRILPDFDVAYSKKTYVFDVSNFFSPSFSHFLRTSPPFHTPIFSSYIYVFLNIYLTLSSSVPFLRFNLIEVFVKSFII